MIIQMTLNHKEIEAPKGSTILEVAREHGVDIPTLCYHEALGVYGVCRLCVVEVGGTLPPSIRISCAQNVQNGLIVDTDSKKVQKNRQFLFELLLARSPDSKQLIDLRQNTVFMNRGFIWGIPMTIACVAAGAFEFAGSGSVPMHCALPTEASAERSPPILNAYPIIVSAVAPVPESAPPVPYG
jgi:ferredoxin